MHGVANTRTCTRYLHTNTLKKSQVIISVGSEKKSLLRSYHPFIIDKNENTEKEMIN